MEHQKKTNFLDIKPNERAKFRTTNWFEIN